MLWFFLVAGDITQVMAHSKGAGWWRNVSGIDILLLPHPAPTKSHGRCSAGHAAGACDTWELLHRHWHFSGKKKKDKETLLKCHISVSRLCVSVKVSTAPWYFSDIIECHSYTRNLIATVMKASVHPCTHFKLFLPLCFSCLTWHLWLLYLGA